MFVIYDIYYLKKKKKRNEVLRQATTWMNLKNFMLSERSQSQKTSNYMKYPEQKNPQKQKLN